MSLLIVYWLLHQCFQFLSIQQCNKLNEAMVWMFHRHYVCELHQNALDLSVSWTFACPPIWVQIWYTRRRTQKLESCSITLAWLHWWWQCSPSIAICNPQWDDLVGASGNIRGFSIRGTCQALPNDSIASCTRMTPVLQYCHALFTLFPFSLFLSYTNQNKSWYFYVHLPSRSVGFFCFSFDGKPLLSLPPLTLH